MLKKHHESLSDVHSTPSIIDPTSSSISKPQEDFPSNSDVPASVPTAKNKEMSNNQDELSSDVNIAPSGIVRKEDNDFQCQTINSESDEGNPRLQENSDFFQHDYICLTSVTHVKCSVCSTLCWKIGHIFGST